MEVVDCVAMGPMCRVVGTVDIDGNGTEFELPDGTPFTHAGPFITADLVSIPEAAGFKAPFCAHPHSGAAILSIMLEGQPWRAWDNLRGGEADTLRPGGIYMLNSGYGGVHDEKPDPICVAGIQKATFGPEDDAHGVGMSFMQLWFNPGGLDSLDGRPVTSQVIGPAAVPVVTDGPLALRVLAGKHAGAESPLELPHELLLLHGRLAAGGTTTLALPAGHEGFITLVKDSAASATVGGRTLAHKQVGILRGDDAAQLTLTAPAGGAPMLFLLGVGVTHTTGYCKLMGFGGALVEATPEAARAKMAVYAADPQNFGKAAHQKVRADEPLPDLSEDLSGFTMIEGFQNKADGLMPGVKARWSVAD